MKDEHGMPLPDAGSWLPWSNEGDEILSENETNVTALMYHDDADFIVHAANHIIACREIVRRLIEWHFGPLDKHVSLCDIVADAKKLWAKMQKEAKGDE